MCRYTCPFPFWLFLPFTWEPEIWKEDVLRVKAMGGWSIETRVVDGKGKMGGARDSRKEKE